MAYKIPYCNSENLCRLCKHDIDVYAGPCEIYGYDRPWSSGRGPVSSESCDKAGSFEPVVELCALNIERCIK